MNNLLRLIRPKQWLKNMFVFLPIFFGGVFFHTDALLNVVLTFLVFCCVASAVYCFNDICDADADRQHPVKCKRPIASGKVSMRAAYGLMALLLVIATALLFLLPEPVRWKVAIVVGFYYFMNLGYCSILKNYAILDVCIVAFGFVLRVLAGGFAGGITPSGWIVLMTFLLTLFLSFAKRRDDVLLMQETGIAPRKNTSRYNFTFINQAITITATVTLVCYIMYTVSPEVKAQFNTPYLYLTSVFVLLGLLRYIQIAVVDQKSGNPVKVILRDRFIQLDVLAWLAAFLVIIYL